MPKPKQTVKAHLKEQLTAARADISKLNTALIQLQERNDNQNTQLQNMLNLEFDYKNQIATLNDELSSTRSKLDNSQAAYTFRHNQELETSRQLQATKRELANLQFEHSMTVREITRLLLLEQFSGGKENELMLTRSRNRLLEAILPTKQEAQEVVTGNAEERRDTEEQLEETRS